jgi:hypothetical protein
MRAKLTDFAAGASVMQFLPTAEESYQSDRIFLFDQLIEQDRRRSRPFADRKSDL